MAPAPCLVALAASEQGLQRPAQRGHPAPAVLAAFQPLGRTGGGGSKPVYGPPQPCTEHSCTALPRRLDRPASPPADLYRAVGEGRSSLPTCPLTWTSEEPHRPASRPGAGPVARAVPGAVCGPASGRPPAGASRDPPGICTVTQEVGTLVPPAGEETGSSPRGSPGSRRAEATGQNVLGAGVRAPACASGSVAAGFTRR